MILIIHHRRLVKGRRGPDAAATGRPRGGVFAGDNCRLISQEWLSLGPPLAIDERAAAGAFLPAQTVG
jgi:hypothetical protein